MERGSTTINIQTNLEQSWATHIQQREKSGLSKATYCKQNNLAYHQYLYWEQKLIKPSVASELIPVEIEQSSAKQLMQSVLECGETNKKQHLLCALNLKNGNVLQIFDAAALNVLITILR